MLKAQEGKAGALDAKGDAKGTFTVLWGQVRPGHGTQSYRLQRFDDGRWEWASVTARTNAHGFFRRAVHAAPGSVFRLWTARRLGTVLVVR